MTVSKTGPAGYEHQYRVSALLGLTLASDTDELFIERCGEEDATLRLRHDGAHLTLEIQVKSSTSRLSPQALAAILTTFPRADTDHCLLERLVSNEHALALIFIGGPASDGIAGLEVPDALFPSTARLTPALTLANSRSLLELVRLTEHPSKTFGVKRKAKCSDIASTLGARGLRQLSKRIFIFSNYTSPKVLREIANTLTSTFLVPAEIATSIADEPLRRIVESARDGGGSCSAALHREARRHSSERIAPRAPYLPLTGEGALYEDFLTRQFILLAGLPLCGKTQLAYAFSQRLQRAGVHVRKCQTVEEATRFLLEPASGESRAAVLEDPCGKIRLDRDAGENWSRLSQLATDLPAARRFIATSRTDILAAFHGSASPKSWAITGTEWVEISALTSPAQVAEVWTAWAKDQNRDQEEIKAIEGRILSNADLSSLQPGHVAFLSLDHRYDYRTLSNLQVNSLARRDAVELSRDLCSSDASKAQLLRALGASATTLRGPSESNLAFITEDKSDAYPGQRPDSYTESFIVLPTANAGTSFSDPSLHALDNFERRGIVEWKSERCVFTHPLWEEAGRIALLGRTLALRKQRERLLRKALFAGDVEAAESAVRALGWLCQTAEDPSAIPEDVFATLESGTKCVFPRVSDSALEILLDNLPQLGDERKKTTIRTATLANYSARQLSWNGKVAWVSQKGDGFELGAETSRVFNIQRRLPALLNKEPRSLSPQELLQVLDHADEHNASTYSHLELGLSADESVLRSRAAKLVAQHHNRARPDLVDRSLSDPHPEVICSTMIGLALSWHSVGPAAQVGWMRALEQKLGIVGIGLAGLNTLTGFRQWSGWDPAWYSGTESPWAFWAACCRAALETDPGYFRINDARVYDLASQAMKVLPPAEVVRFCDSWQTWVEKRLRHGYVSDYAASVGDVLLSTTSWKAPGRRLLVRRITSQQDSAFQCILVRDLLRDWKMLSPPEREMLSDCIAADRVDHKWVVAAALIEGKTPICILTRLGLPQDFFQLAPSAAVLATPPGQLHHVLRLFCGHPGALAATGIHHSNEEYWGPVLAEIAKAPAHPAFRLSLREVVCRDGQDVAGLTLWKGLCSKGDKATVQLLFDALFLDATQSTNSNNAELWKLLTLSPKANTGRWRTRVTKEIEAIDYADNAKMVLQHFPNAYKLLQPRFRVYRLARLARQTMEDPDCDADSLTVFRVAAKGLLKESTPRGHEVVNWLVEFAWPDRDARAGDPEYEAAETVRRAELEKGYARQRELREDSKDPSDWVVTEKSHETRST